MSVCFFFFSSRRRHTRLQGDWSSDVCSSDLVRVVAPGIVSVPRPDLPVLRVELAGFRGARVEHGVVAVTSRELDRVLVAAREPQRGIRPLVRLDVELEVTVGEIFPLVVEDAAPAGGKKDLQRLAVALARLID